MFDFLVLYSRGTALFLSCGGDDRSFLVVDLGLSQQDWAGRSRQLAANAAMMVNPMQDHSTNVNSRCKVLPPKAIHAWLGEDLRCPNRSYGKTQRFHFKSPANSDPKLPLSLRTLRPLTAFKSALNPKFVKNFVPTIVFRGSNQGDPNLSKIYRNFENDNFRTNLQIFNKFLTNLGPLDWNPEKQSLGQIFDKFGVWGIFECCKGPEGSQLSAS